MHLYSSRKNVAIDCDYFTRKALLLLKFCITCINMNNIINYWIINITLFIQITSIYIECVCVCLHTTSNYYYYFLYNTLRQISQVYQVLWIKFFFGSAAIP